MRPGHGALQCRPDSSTAKQKNSYILRRITVGGQGGRLTRGQVDLVTEGLGYELAPGGDYVLLLTFSKGLCIFTLTPFDVFRVDGPRVTTTEYGLTTKYGKEINGKPTAAALAVLRAACRALVWKAQ